MEKVLKTYMQSLYALAYCIMLMMAEVTLVYVVLNYLNHSYYPLRADMFYIWLPVSTVWAFFIMSIAILNLKSCIHDLQNNE